LPGRTFDPSSLHRLLFDHYGPSRWWPGDTPFEVMVGAVLTQNTAWTNVEKAIVNLKSAGLMDPASVEKADTGFLASLLRPSGYYNIKASRLKNLVRMIMDAYGGDTGRMADAPLHELRQTLLEVKGIGKETADSICCYAAGKCVFVVDAYTVRILRRHGIVNEHDGYDAVQQFFEKGLPRRLPVYKDLHAHIVFIGKDFCRTRNPRCEACPLNGRI
jgi:endonuclease-3 related protein